MFRPQALPPPLAAVLEQVRTWSDPASNVATTSRPGQPDATPDERAAWVAGLQQLRDAADAASLMALAGLDAAADGEVLHGAASTPGWLRGALGIAPGDAAERVRLARSSRDLLRETADELRQGALTYDHLRTIDRAVRPLPEALQAEAVSVLTDLAVQRPVADVRTAARHLRLVADPDGTLSECEQHFERRYLALAPMLDGMTAVNGLLDTESAALLTAALEPFLVPSGPEDLRSAAQRRADGLLDIVRTACDHRLLPEVGGERPHLQVLIPETLVGNLRVGILPQAPGGRDLLHPTCVERISCDAEFLPVLLDPGGRPMALGRSQRLFSGAQRRLLALRDGGCRFPDCSRPPAHTDAHHVLAWSAGGATDVENAALLCRFHHRLVHEGGWHVVSSDAGLQAHGSLTFKGPRGQSLVSEPRGP